MSLEPWEVIWLDHRDEWDRETWNWPGVLSALCQMDALDWMGAAQFKEWQDRDPAG